MVLSAVAVPGSTFRSQILGKTVFDDTPLSEPMKLTVIATWRYQFTGHANKAWYVTNLN